MSSTMVGWHEEQVAKLTRERDEWQKRAQRAELGWARARLALKAIAQMPGTLRPDEVARAALSDEETP